MTDFEEKGCDLQYNSRNTTQATERFEYSCDKCCILGRPLKCLKSQCPIEYAHKQVVDYFACHQTAEIEDFQRYERWAYA